MSKYAYYSMTYTEKFMPAPPENVLAEYPYVWLNSDGTTDKLVFSKQKYYYNSATKKLCIPLSETYPIYKLSNGTWVKDTQYTNTGNWSNMSYLKWSNHDIHYDSPDSGKIYFASKELVPEEEILTSTSQPSYFIQKDTLTDLADIARDANGTTGTLSIDEMKTIFSG